MKAMLRRLMIYRAGVIICQMPDRIDRLLYYQVRWLTGKFGTAKTNRAYRLMNYYSEVK